MPKKKKELIISPVYNDKGNIIGQEYHGGLIRCMDCMYNKNHACNLPPVEKREVEDEDYCSWAERKEE